MLKETALSNTEAELSKRSSKDALIADLLKRLAEGDSIQEVAAALGVDAQTLRKLILSK